MIALVQAVRAFTGTVFSRVHGCKDLNVQPKPPLVCERLCWKSSARVSVELQAEENKRNGVKSGCNANEQTGVSESEEEEGAQLT